MLAPSRTSTLFVAFAALFNTVQSATPAEWRSRSIYQVFTDRFARTDLSTTATCASCYNGYCGGTWQGIISMLDYIQVRVCDTVQVHLLTGPFLSCNRTWALQQLDISRCSTSHGSNSRIQWLFSSEYLRTE